LSETRVLPFTYRDYVALAGSEAAQTGIVCQTGGPAFTLVEGEKILAVGGVRTLGIGQAWCALSEDARRHRAKTVLQTARGVLEQCIINEKLYRVYAEAEPNTATWFRHMGFVPDTRLYVR
jgi:hypothetical protein